MAVSVRKQPLPEVESSPTVPDLIDEAVTDIHERSNGGVFLRVEAEEIWNRMEKENLKGLLAWVRSQGIGMIRQTLQMRLAHLRSLSRDSAIRRTSVDGAPRPFEARMAVSPDGRWKAIGDMKKVDWQYVIDNRGEQAKANLFDLALARLVAAKLPDDETSTRDALSEEEFEALERSANQRAAQSVGRFGRSR